MKEFKFTFIALIIIVGLSILILPHCTDEKGTKKVLEKNHYKPLEIGGYGWWYGGRDELYRTKFKAISPNGDTITGCVTDNPFFGPAIRIDN